MSNTRLYAVAAPIIDAPSDWPGVISDRTRLLDAACRAGLQPEAVVRLAQRLTGHGWDSCGRPEIELVARALLEAAHRAVGFQNNGTRPCAK